MDYFSVLVCGAPLYAYWKQFVWKASRIVLVAIPKPNGCETVKQRKRNTVLVFVGIGMMEM